jgi:3-oxoacyl-[acyl-carrier-protein] synthase II
MRTVKVGSKRRVVVTGLGVTTALGLQVSENWEKLLAGTSGIRRLSYAGSEKSSLQAAGAVTEDDWGKIKEEFPEDNIHEGERRTLFALWAVKSALKDAGMLDFSGDGQRYGVVLAAGLGINRPEDIQRWADKLGTFDYIQFGREYKMVHHESLIRNNSNRPAALIGKRFKLYGINCTVTTACASGTQAIGSGYRSIQSGDADMVVAGGADSMINPVGLIFFVLLGAASVSSEDPHAVCRPFDRKRSGLVMGEGAGITVLEEEQHAVKRGARIYAEITGYGSSMDAHQVTAPHPSGRGAEHSMRLALRDARMHSDEIDYINAHGTSTKLNDIAETIAIKNVFRDKAYHIPISSSKSMIGHLLAASGGPELVYTVLSVSRDEIHPTINMTHPDPKCDLDYVPHEKRIRTVRAALSNSFGFGGQNASIVVKKYNKGNTA